MPGNDVIEITQKTTVQGPSPTEDAPSFDDGDKDDDDDDGEGEGVDEEDDGNDSNAQEEDEDEDESDSDSKPEPSETEHSDPSDAPPETQHPGNPSPTVTPPPSSNNDGSGDVSPHTTIVTLDHVPVTIIDYARSIIVGNTDAERITITENDVSTTFTADGREWTVNPSEIICSDSTFMIETIPVTAFTPTASANEGTITATATATTSSSSWTDTEDGNEYGSGNGGDEDGEDGTATGSAETSEDPNPNLAASITGSDLKISLAFGTITAFVFGGMFGML